MEECVFRHKDLDFEFAQKLYAENSYYDRNIIDDVEGIIEPFQYLLQAEKEKLLEEWKIVSKNSLSSLGTKEINLKMYDGTCGTIYCMLRFKKYLNYKQSVLLRQYQKKNKEETSKEDNSVDRKLLDIRAELLELEDQLDQAVDYSHQNSLLYIVNNDKNTSFFDSELVGIAFLTVLKEFSLEENERDIEKIKKIISDKILPAISHLNKDKLGLFDGATGYLYVLLELWKNLPESREIKETIIKVVNFIKEHSILKPTEILNVTSSRKVGNLTINQKKQLGREKIYFIGPKGEMGASKGFCGVVYMLITAMKLVPELKSDLTLYKIIAQSLEKVLSMVLWSGHLPSKIDQGDKYPKSVQFCDGTSGTIPLLIQASYMFPSMSQSLQEAAQKAGELTWQYGLLLKGNSLCHGISGNGYMFHSLYRMYKLKIKEFQSRMVDTGPEVLKNSSRLGDETQKFDDELKFLKRQAGKWRIRAYMFGFATRSKSIQKKCSRHHFPGRNVKGQPDYPFSLMEGISGQICFLSDLLADEDDVRFPGFEV